MQVEHRVKVAAPPEAIFQIYRDVARWHTWDPDTRQASLEGPFEVGSRGRLTPTKGRAVPMLLTAVSAERGFTVESRLPGLLLMRFEHELSRAADGTEVTHRVSITGLLSVVIGPMLVRQLNAGLPVTLGKLKALAEGLCAA